MTSGIDGTAPRILVVDADPALAGLLEEWLGELGFRLVDERPDLVLVDVAFPRERGLEALKQVVEEHRGTPVVALSSGFFGRIESDGAVARSLGVAGVLPKPVDREALVAAVRRLLPVPG